MKISENWLREWVNPDISTEQLTDQLTMAGLEVDGLDILEQDLPGVVVARVESKAKHPDSSKLSICEVNFGDKDMVTVVCGAANVKAGCHYPYATTGTVLPDGMTISERNVAGIESQGMLCSEIELGLGDDESGLMELSAESQPGIHLSEYLQLKDALIEISLTPNRGDCLSIAGIAREVGVINQLTLQSPEVHSVSTDITSERSIILQDAAACPHYVGRVIEGIDINKPAPDWMREKLRRCGLRSINIIVDVTNYILLELGQPMHAFDNNKLNGDITVRMAKQSESLQLLDGKECNISAGTLLITDANGPVALAGIMGGMETSVTDSTENIFLESAYFSPDVIAGRARSYGMHTDASHRYERGVDFNLQVHAIERATAFIIEYAGGKAGPLIDSVETENLPDRSPVELRKARVNHILGLDIESDEIEQMLKSLDMKVVATNDGWTVTPPSFRFDIEKEIDLVEEVARLYGYDNITVDVPKPSGRIRALPEMINIRALKQCLLERGYSEAITYSFVDQDFQSNVLNQDGQIPLQNPISADLSVMRQSLLPGLLRTLSYNYKRQQGRIRLFEHGMVFQNRGDIVQKNMLAGIISGKLYEKQLDISNISSEISDIKADFQALTSKISPDLTVNYLSDHHHAFHPGRSAKITLNNQDIGYLGAIHPSLLVAQDIKQNVYAFEIEMTAFSDKKQVKYAKFSKYPTIRRDIAILVETEISVSKVMESIENACSDLLQNLELFDVYQGEGIDIEKKSLALGLTFQGTSSNLTDDEVDGKVDGVLKALKKEFGATLRE